MRGQFPQPAETAAESGVAKDGWIVGADPDENPIATVTVDQSSEGSGPRVTTRSSPTPEPTPVSESGRLLTPSLAASFGRLDRAYPSNLKVITRSEAGVRVHELEQTPKIGHGPR